MVKLLFVALMFLALSTLGSSKWAMDHQYTPSISAEVAEAIKKTLLANIGVFSDKDFASDLEADLNEADDSKRALKELSANNAAEIFQVLGLEDPECDQNEDNKVKDDELKCLNFAWKGYLPH